MAEFDVVDLSDRENLIAFIRQEVENEVDGAVSGIDLTWEIQDAAGEAVNDALADGWQPEIESVMDRMDVLEKKLADLDYWKADRHHVHTGGS